MGFNEIKGNKPLLVVAHPGHEMLLHGWMEETRPHVLILTDGSGRSGKPRIGAASVYLSDLSLTPGSLFGRYPDLELYDKILAQEMSFFIELVEEVTETILTHECDYVVADSAEGYNSVHDLCRMLVDCAVARVERTSGRSVANYDYPVVKGLTGDIESKPGEIKTSLQNPVFERKLAAANKYYPELLREIREALSGVRDTSYLEYLERYDPNVGMAVDPGVEVFRVERVRPVRESYAEMVQPRPYYERRGEKRTADGVYNQVIRYSDHMLPIASRLQEYSQAAAIAHA